MNFNDIDKLEDAPKSQKMREGMERRYKGIYSNYPWSKVERFLTSRLGKSQAEVTSEFLKLNWLPKEHRTIKQFNYHVETNTFIHNGQIYVNDNKYWAINEHYLDIFYIHPETELLCFQKKKKTNWAKIYREEKAQTMRILGDYWQLLKLDGIWYEVKGKPLDKDFKPDQRMIGENNLVNKSSYWPNICPWYSVEITLKKELNSKELKKFGLTNDGPKMSGKKCPKCGGYNCRIHLTIK